MAAEPTEKLKKNRVTVEEGYVARKFVFEAEAGQTVGCDKFVCVATDRDHKDDELTGAATAGVLSAQEAGYDALRREQERAWARLGKADVRIDGDVAGQQGIRFNIFQLFSTYYGEDARLNIGPKGFTGENTAARPIGTRRPTACRCTPPSRARKSRRTCSNTAGCKSTARITTRVEQGLPGALYPMVTFTGVECHNEWEITFEEIHRNNAIAYAILRLHAVHRRPQLPRSIRHRRAAGHRAILGGGACTIPSARINT